MVIRIVLDVVLVPVLLAVTVTDLRTRRIPNRITGPAAALAIVLGLVLHPSGVPDQLLAGLAAAGFLFVFAAAYPSGLGMGDVKLAGVLGVYLGASVAVALVVGFTASAVVGVIVLVRLGVARGRKVGMPLGPFLAAGGLTAVVLGTQIVHWYTSHTVI